MKWNRIFAIYLRHLYMMRRSYDKLVDTFYWVTIDLFLWGLTSLYFQRFTPNAQDIIFMFISGVVFWNIAYRTQADVNMSLLEELWNKNLINIFVSPLTFVDWVVSVVLLGLTKAAMSIFFASLLAFGMYKVSILSYSWHFIPFTLLLIMTGWWMGFFISGIILRYGTKVQALGWTLVWLISPFSAIYFPLSALPDWAQKISLLVPPSYVFEEARRFISTGVVQVENLYISFFLNVILLIVSFIFLQKSYKKVLEKGLVKVY